jgi:HSP20 family protein
MALNSKLLPWKWGKKNVPIRREDALPDYAPVFSLQQDMNRLFDNFFQSFENRLLSPFGEMTGSGVFNPSIDITESERDLKVTVELPGLSDKDIDLSMTNNTLSIKGEKREEKEEETSGYYRMERSYGSFFRSIPLPCGIEKDKVDATFKNGVLTISLPKSKEAQQETKKITITRD